MESEAGQNIPDDSLTIEIKNVTFAYPSNKD